MAAPGTDFVNSLDPNPLHWPGELSKALGLSPQDQPGVGGRDTSHNVIASPSTYSTLANGKQIQYQFDPITGQYIDPTTGQVIQNPNVAQQVAATSVRQREAEQSAGEYGQRESDIFGQQSDLAGYLNDVIAGKTPSVAELQLGRGLDSIRRQAVGIAGTATGANMPLAQLTALQTVGRAGGEANQQASINRAAESAAARGELANLLNAQQASSQKFATDKDRLALDYGDMALRGQSAQQGLTLEGDKANAKGTAAVMKGLGELIGI